MNTQLKLIFGVLVFVALSATAAWWPSALLYLLVILIVVLSGAVWVLLGEVERLRGLGKLPEITDETDRQILDLVTKNPGMSDGEIGLVIGLSRQAVNTRRQKLGAMGYMVRKN
jgi:predicted transcriptional regulator